MKKISAKNRNDLLKLIGIVSMAIDHVGHVFFPQVMIFRIIGRLAFPIFAFAIADGYRHTSNLKKYFFRLLLFAMISQIPFMLAIEPMKLNVLFTLALSLGVLWAIDKKQYFVAVLLVVLSVIVPMDFGFFGALAAPLFYFFNDKRLQIGLFALLTVVHNVFVQWPVQLFSLLGVLLVLFFPAKMLNIKFIRLPRYFFYWFYPGHLLLLFLIKELF